ncbi:hypothetical protein ARC78_08965 [Stenotrophomonas pictorum JCM 9942]|uniref:BON domain-containing protein n=1 Tax=Stenotrophomonas pictorum JCM 9942 TaxID=1236960 RepID=A0A0R0AP69_9GAMM|nr:BON domain-containing protein [Stenotrophomonas pictorum]KRG42807.1 hypothetical protein ARC78_08965 [Stenotrophomonas pictorum JCM 9942]
MSAPRSDTLIGDDVVRSLGQHGRASQVLVQVQDGCVALRGDVPDHQTRHEVEQLVGAIDGVREVRSTLHVDSGEHSFGAPGQAVRDNPDGQEIGRLAGLEQEQDMDPER